MKESLSNIVVETVCTAGAVVAGGFAYQAWTGAGREFFATISFVVAGFVLYAVCVAPYTRTAALCEAMDRILDELQKTRMLSTRSNVNVRR